VDLSKLSLSDKILTGGGLVLFFASFFPWFSVSVSGFGSATASGWRVGFWWGGLPALLGLAAAGAVLASKLGTTTLPTLPVSWGQVFLGAGTLSAGIVILKLLVGESSVPGVNVNRSWGLFLATVAAIAFAYGGFLKFNEEKAASPSSS
jgi:hypothetical protein